MKSPQPSAARHLLALAAGAMLAATAQAAPIYFTFEGQTVAGVGTAYGAAQPGHTGAGPLLDAILTSPGSAFSFTLGLDNGGNSALGQTWTARDVVSMRFELPTTSGTPYYFNMLFGGASGIPTTSLNVSQGSFGTDANGQVSSVFTALNLTANRSIKSVAPASGQVQTNGDVPLNLFRFGLYDFGYGGTVLALSATFEQHPELSTAVLATLDSATALGWGAGTGLNRPSKWFTSTSTGEALTADADASHAVPEPGSLPLVLTVLGALGYAARRRRQPGA